MASDATEQEEVNIGIQPSNKAEQLLASVRERTTGCSTRQAKSFCQKVATTYVMQRGFSWAASARLNACICFAHAV